MVNDPFKTKKQITVNGKNFDYYSLEALSQQGYEIDKLPFSP